MESLGVEAAANSWAVEKAVVFSDAAAAAVCLSVAVAAGFLDVAVVGF